MIERVEGLESAAWRATYELFCHVFDPSTREPDEQLFAEINGTWPQPFEYRAWMEGERSLGFIRACPFPAENVLYVSHIAVRPEAQRRGIGSALLADVRQEYQDLIVTCEAEPGAATDWWTGQRLFVLTPTYTQPALRSYTEPVPFQLMVSRLPENPERFIEGFYAEAWRIPADHAFVKRALGGLR